MTKQLTLSGIPVHSSEWFYWDDVIKYGISSIGMISARAGFDKVKGGLLDAEYQMHIISTETNSMIKARVGAAPKGTVRLYNVIEGPEIMRTWNIAIYNSDAEMFEQHPDARNVFDNHANNV